MRKLIKKFWTELTRLRRIEFISYETEEEQNERLARDMAQRKFEIMKRNYIYLMQKFIKEEQERVLNETNMLVPTQQILINAHARFCKARLEGAIDELNRIVERNA